MDYALIGFILAMAIMAFVVAGSYSPEAPTHLIERRRSAYHQALHILRNNPHNPNYVRLVHATGMAYAEIEDPSIFNEAHITADITTITSQSHT